MIGCLVSDVCFEWEFLVIVVFMFVVMFGVLVRVWWILRWCDWGYLDVVVFWGEDCVVLGFVIWVMLLDGVFECV